MIPLVDALFNKLINDIDSFMKICNVKKVIINLVCLCSLMACSNTEPYIYNADEFDRDSPNFGKDITDRAEVVLCYNKSSTTPLILTQMAIDECGRFGRIAKFIENRHLVCSISSPAQAVFKCLCPDKISKKQFKTDRDLLKKNKIRGCLASDFDDKKNPK